MTIWLFLISTALVAISGLPGLLLSRRSRLGQHIATALNVCGAAVAGVALVAFWTEPASTRALTSTWTLPFGRFAVAVDGLSPVFLIPMFLISAAGSIYGLSYWSQPRHPSNGRKLRLCWGLMTAGMIMVILARDGIVFLMSWEVMAIAAFFLVTTEDTKSNACKAGWIYLMSTHVGTLSLFAFFALLKYATGSFDLWPPVAGAISPKLASALFVVGCVGFGLKAGIMPLHIWLPGAHANAPSHVSAIMSGVLLKAGVYGLVRIAALFPHPPVWWGGSLLVAGTLSGLLGIAFAAGQRDLKRLLAYSSIENVGIITMGIGLALMGRSLGQGAWIVLGLGGALLHVLNHSLFKPLMFFGAGSVLHAVHTRVMDLMGGLGSRMPKTSLLVLIGAVAICGLPPLNGFVSELLIYLGLFRTIMTESNAVGWASLAAPALALIGAMAVASFVKVLGAVFAGTPRTARAALAHDPGFAMLLPMVVLAGCCLFIGLLPWAVVGLLNAALLQWIPPDQSVLPTIQSYVSLRWISALSVILLAIIGAGGLWLLRRPGRSSTRAALTWDCGYALPTPRIQYSGSSFSQTLVDLLSWVLWPRTHQPRIGGAFPQTDEFHSEVPDVVLDRALIPSLGAADAVLGRARVIQRGTVQVYLVYVLAILLLLLLLG
jgi:hydrogenase-4 component B